MSIPVPPWRPTATPMNEMSSTNVAYHSIQHPRLSFERPPVVIQAPIPAPQPIEKKRIKWPEQVRQYVQRAFEESNLVRGIERSEMEMKLRDTITKATDENLLFSINWDSMPLPQTLIQLERANSIPPPPPSMIYASFGPAPPVRMDHEPQSRKRKSTDSDNSLVDDSSAQPPWQKTNSPIAFQDRISYPEKRQRKLDDNSPAKGMSKLQKQNLEKRKRRFEDGSNGVYSPQPWSSRSQSPLPDQGPIIGRSQKLEKKYFRLTSAPNPDDVRPLPVLEKTLALLKRKWRDENNYSYICDQFKSLRQDLTVQHIKNDFTVNVYEIHARIALEKGDLGEYNQCQTQLRGLYSQKLGGHPMEFKAYRILYFIHTCNRTDMNDVLADLTQAEKKDRAVKHALDVRSALALGNYHKFFRLYLDTPNMGAYLMDMFVNRERLAALSNICKAYRMDVKLRFITEELGFESDAESAQFVLDHGGENLLEDRNSEIFLLASKAGQLFELAKKAAFQRVDIKGQI